MWEALQLTFKELIRLAASDLKMTYAVVAGVGLIIGLLCLRGGVIRH